MYLLDTDTIVHVLRGHEKTIARIRVLENAPKAISIITMGELLYGAKKSSKPVENEAHVRRIAQLFAVIPVDAAVMEIFVHLKTNLEREGARLDDFDLFIAATSMVMSYTLVTGNEKHFSRIEGLRTDNWTKR